MVVIGANYNPSGLIRHPHAPPSLPHEWSSELVRDLYSLLPDPEDANSPGSDELKELWATGPDLTPAELHKIKAQVLVVGGEYDLIDQKHLIATQQAIPGARLRIFPGVGHGLMQDIPARMNQTLRKFLLDQDGRPQSC